MLSAGHRLTTMRVAIANRDVRALGEPLSVSWVGKDKDEWARIGSRALMACVAANWVEGVVVLLSLTSNETGWRIDTTDILDRLLDLCRSFGSKDVEHLLLHVQ
jgi:hypothetical protein